MTETAARPGPVPGASGGPRSERPTLAVGLLVVLVALVVAMFAVGTPNSARWTLLALVGACWVAFGAAVWALLRVPVRTAVPLILLGAVVLQLVAIAVPPRSTDDFYRYAWDGRVQASGTDPYRYAPVDDALADLRDPWLFPPECRDGTPPCTRMNHPTSPTIYPPVAEAAFLALHVVTRPLGESGGREKPLQILGALLALATTGALLRVLARVGDPRLAVLWAWCPAVLVEASNNAHIDVLAALLAVVTLGAAVSGRRNALDVAGASRPVYGVTAGIALGAAIATKLFPALLLPGLLARPPLLQGRRRPDETPTWRTYLTRVGPLLAAAAVTLAVVYLPHVIAVGARVLGFLPGYLAEEGYEGGARFPVLQLVLPDGSAAVVGPVVLVAVAVGVLLRSDPARPWRGSVVVLGLALGLAGVTYPWYSLLLVALVALDGRWEWLAIAAAAIPGYYSRALDLPVLETQQVGYGLGLALVLLVTLARRRLTPRATPGDDGASAARRPSAAPAPAAAPPPSAGPAGP